MHGHSWWILLSDSARFALDRRTRANAGTQCFIPGQIINNRAARSFRYTVLPVGSRSRLRSYKSYPRHCKTLLHYCIINQRLFTVKQLNEQIKTFKYGYSEKANAPRPIDGERLTSDDNKFVQSGMFNHV